MEPTTHKRESFGEIIRGDVPVLVDFWAPWCAPCRMMKPILEDLHRRMGDRLRILKIDTDQQPAIAGQFQIQGIPTLILFQQGKQLWRHSGVMQAGQLEQIVRSYSTNQ